MAEGGAIHPKPKSYNAATHKGECSKPLNAEDSKQQNQKINQSGGIRMQKQTIEFAVQTSNGVVQKVGKSSILQPKTNYTGKGTKWFDDSQLIKKERASK